MKNFYFTFGQAHKLKTGESLADCFCPVYASTEDAAKRKMTEARGNLWAKCYGSREAAGIKEFGLKEVKLELIKIY